MEKLKEACELYLSGMNTVQIGKMIGMSYEAVRSRLHRGGVKIRSRFDRQSVYNVDETCFKKATIDSMYFAGFLFADGNVRKSEKLFQVELSSKDREILLRLKQFLKYDGPIENRTRKARGKIFKRSALRVSSSKIIQDLKKYGVVPKKTDNAVIPDWVLNHKFAVFFLRGLFDGDGCVGKRNGSFQKGDFFMTIGGTPIVVESFRDWMCKTVGSSGGFSKRTKTFWVLGYGDKDAKSVGHILYSSKRGPRLCRKERLFHCGKAV